MFARVPCKKLRKLALIDGHHFHESQPFEGVRDETPKHFNGLQRLCVSERRELTQRENPKLA